MALEIKTTVLSLFGLAFTFVINLNLQTNRAKTFSTLEHWIRGRRKLGNIGNDCIVL